MGRSVHCCWEGNSLSFPGKRLAMPHTLLESHLKKMTQSLEIKMVTTLPFIDAEGGEPASNHRSGCSPLHGPGNRPVSPLCPRTLQPELPGAASLAVTPRRERFCTRFQSVWGLPPTTTSSQTWAGSPAVQPPLDTLCLEMSSAPPGRGLSQSADTTRCRCPSQVQVGTCASDQMAADCTFP